MKINTSHRSYTVSQGSQNTVKLSKTLNIIMIIWRWWRTWASCFLTVTTWYWHVHVYTLREWEGNMGWAWSPLPVRYDHGSGGWVSVWSQGLRQRTGGHGDLHACEKSLPWQPHSSSRFWALKGNGRGTGGLLYVSQSFPRVQTHIHTHKHIIQNMCNIATIHKVHSSP